MSVPAAAPPTTTGSATATASTTPPGPTWKGGIRWSTPDPLAPPSTPPPAFGNEDIAWAVGIIVGTVLAVAILVAIALCFREILRRYCPDKVSPVQPVESQVAADDDDDRLSMHSVGPSDRAPREIGEFAADDGAQEDYSDAEGSDAENPRRQRVNRPMTDAMRRIIAAERIARSGPKIWRY